MSTEINLTMTVWEAIGPVCGFTAVNPHGYLRHACSLFLPN